MLGTDTYSGIFTKLSANRIVYLNEIRKIISTHYVGMLVLDEFQNLSLMGVGAKKIIALLVNLRDELGIPIVVVGTSKALKLLNSDLSVARRLNEGGCFDLERPLSHENEYWYQLCSTAWDYQWVRNPAEFSGEIAKALYDVSQGISGIMLSVLATAQSAAMEDGGTETVDAALIRKVYKERMVLLHPAIRVLQSGDPRLMEKFEDLYKNAYPGSDRSEEMPSVGEPPMESAKLNAEEQELILTSTPSRNARRNNPRTPSQAGGLNRAQTEKLVRADSISDLVALLDHV